MKNNFKLLSVLAGLIGALTSADAFAACSAMCGSVCYDPTTQFCRNPDVCQLNVQYTCGSPCAREGCEPIHPVATGYRYDNSNRMVFRNSTGSVILQTRLADGTWRRDDVTALANAPMALGHPFPWEAGSAFRILYRGIDHHIHELALWAGAWLHFDHTSTIGGPLAMTDPMGFIGIVPRIVYAGRDRHIHMYSYDNGWKHTDLNAMTGAMLTAPFNNGNQTARPMGFQGTTTRIVYTAADAHVHEISLNGGSWTHADLNAQSSHTVAAVDSDGPPWGYSGGGTDRIVYRGIDYGIHEISLANGRWNPYGLTENDYGAPASFGNPMGYMADVARVVYIGVAGTLEEFALTSNGWSRWTMLTQFGNPAPGAYTDPRGYWGSAANVTFWSYTGSYEFALGSQGWTLSSASAQ